MKRWRRIGIGLLAVMLGLLPVVSCSKARDRWASIEGKGPKVLVSFAGLYSLVKGVGGDQAQVLSLLTTTGPHDYAHNQEDVLAAVKADLFIVNGLGLDDFMTTIKGSSDNKQLQVIDLGNIFKSDEELAKLLLPPNKRNDPHMWLGIEPAKEIVKIVRNKLSEAAPEHKDHYQKNAEAMLKKLDELHAHGKKALANKKNKRIVATHDSLRYFARSFDVTVVENLMPQPGVDADGAKLKKLIDVFTDKDNPVHVITVEPQWNDKTATTLIAQIKSKVKDQNLVPKLVNFDTLETAQEPNLSVDFYFNKMTENLDNLAGNWK